MRLTLIRAMVVMMVVMRVGDLMVIPLWLLMMMLMMTIARLMLLIMMIGLLLGMMMMIGMLRRVAVAVRRVVGERIGRRPVDEVAVAAPSTDAAVPTDIVVTRVVVAVVMVSVVMDTTGTAKRTWRKRVRICIMYYLSYPLNGISIPRVSYSNSPNL